MGEDRRHRKTPKRPSPLDRLSPWDGPSAAERPPVAEPAPSPGLRSEPFPATMPPPQESPALPDVPSSSVPAPMLGSELPPAKRSTATPAVRRTGYRSRTERRMARRAKRRRKAVARLGMVVGPALVVIAAVVVLFSLLGGSEPDGYVTTTLPVAGVAGPEGRNALLAIEQEDTVPLLVLLYPREQGGTALAMPGLTLLKTGEGFKTLAELHLEGRDKALRAALMEALGVSIDQVAAVEWSAVHAAMESAGLDEALPAVLASGEEECGQVARAVIALAGAAVSDDGKKLWDGLPLEGDADDFRETVDELAATMSGSGWTAATLTGRLVEGRGFTYVEPDVEAAKAALAGTLSQVEVTLQVQNGSGVLGVAQETSGLLASLGYAMLPVGNAKGFPDVERTRIEAAADAAAQAEKVRALLGVGTIQVDPALDSGHIVVIIGKDYIPPQTTITATTD